MINTSIWNIFKKTGNIEAFMYLSKLETLNNNQPERSSKQRIEKMAVNDRAR